MTTFLMMHGSEWTLKYDEPKVTVATIRPQPSELWHDKPHLQQTSCCGASTTAWFLLLLSLHLYCFAFQWVDPEISPRPSMDTAWYCHAVLNNYRYTNFCLIDVMFICYVFMCSNFLDHKVVGCPIHISLDYMARNVLIFNLCFVFDATVKTARYELVLKKVANYLKLLEVPHCWCLLVLWVAQ